MRKSKNQTILSFTTVLILSIVVGIIVWLPQLIKHYYSLSGWITNLLGLALTLLFGTSIFLKNREIRFLKHETIFPFLFILLFIGLSAENLALNKEYIALTCTSLAFYRLINQSNKFSAPWHSMESMLLLSAGSIFAPILWAFIPVFWVGLIVFNKSSFKCILSTFMGIVVPYLVAAGIIYVWNLGCYIEEFLVNVDLTYTLDLPNTAFDWTTLGIFTISTFVGISGLFKGHDDRRYIHWINNFTAIILVVSLVLNIIFYGSGLNITTAYWLTFLLTYYYSNNNNLFAKIYFWLLLIASLGIIAFRA
jgi:hypothetical protein